MYSRAQEINRSILRQERQGTLQKGDQVYKFRTGELRAFIETVSKHIDLGSRRVTQARTDSEMLREGGFDRDD